MTRTRAARRPDPDDIGYQLGFFGPIPWLLAALYVVYLSYAALVLGGPAARSPLGITAFVLLLAALALIVLPSRTPLPRWRTGVVLVTIAFATVVVSWHLPLDRSHFGLLAWEYNPCTLLMCCLTIRARIVAAWIGQLAMQAAVAGWSIAATGSPGYGLASSYGQPFPLLACTIFAIGLHRSTRRIAALRAAERERALRSARESAADRALEVELQHVRELAQPVLEQIAVGADPDPAAVRSLEAMLRDRIRSPNLAVEPLTSALRWARERGMDVVVLDDLDNDALSPDQRHAAAAWAARQVSTATGASMALRIARADGAPLLTITVDGAPRAQLSLPDPAG